MKSEIVNDIEVLYSVGFDDADSMLEDMIRQSSMPKNLTVVSSDHRIHRAAGARRATAVDSNDWIDQLVHRANQAPNSPAQKTTPEKPVENLSDSDRAMWMKRFQLDQSIEEIQNEGSTSSDDDENFYNPFPPGYADDLLD